MKKITYLSIIVLIFVVGLAAACSSDTKTTTTTVNQATTNTNAANTAVNPPAKTEEDAPASVKAAFPDAQSFTKQHKDIPQNAIADLEKDAGAKIPDTDHHSYLAFSNAGGTRKQVGAATVVKADGKEFVVIYDNKEGSPVIKEVRGEGVSNDFLKQFAGKGHDNDLTLGKDIKADGVDEAIAKALT
ncbi:MAG: hypothetical protein ACR2F2_01675, partial [Pyrinomonadaceae bacterium]